jgi:hypothetical protein
MCSSDTADMKMLVLGLAAALGVSVATAVKATNVHHRSSNALAPTTRTQANSGDFSAMARCEGWYEPDLAAGACSPSQLSIGIKTYSLRKKGAFSALIAGHHTATGPGVVQVVGSPVAAGTPVRLIGSPAPDEVVHITFQRSASFGVATLSDIRLSGPRHVVRIYHPSAQPSVALTGIHATTSVALDRWLPSGH